jgi:hypothetical protein
MEHHAGQRANAAVFASEGSVRHHLGRVAVAAIAALLAAWVIALALGVLGGFDSLPGLPSSHPQGSSEASSATPHRQAQSPAPPRTEHVVTPAPSPSTSPSPTSGSDQTRSQGSTPKTTAPQAVQAPTSTVAPTTHGQSATHATTTTGKPLGSPGNGSGGSGAPGKLR